MAIADIHTMLIKSSPYRSVEIISENGLVIATGCYYSNQSEIALFIARVGDELILTDNGRTRSYMDEVFELTEPDVIKNILAVTSYYGINTKGKQLSIRLGTNCDDYVGGYLKMMYCIGFLNDMSMFYT